MPAVLPFAKIEALKKSDGYLFGDSQVTGFKPKESGEEGGAQSVAEQFAKALG